MNFSISTNSPVALTVITIGAISRSPFTGKEKDAESGYHYFGARYYDSEALTGWLSVDPMADKYPSISPYASCAWNPIRLIDEDGKEPIGAQVKIAKSNNNSAKKAYKMHVAKTQTVKTGASKTLDKVFD